MELLLCSFTRPPSHAPHHLMKKPVDIQGFSESCDPSSHGLMMCTRLLFWPPELTRQLPRKHLLQAARKNISSHISSETIVLQCAIISNNKTEYTNAKSSLSRSKLIYYLLYLELRIKRYQFHKLRSVDVITEVSITTVPMQNLHASHAKLVWT
jgi:hypothetical protein